MPDEKSSRKLPAVDVALNGLAGLAGYAVGGPSGAVLGAVGGDLLMQAMKLDAEQMRRKVTRIETVIEAGAQEAGTTWQQLDDKLQRDPDLSELYWRILDVAGGTVSQDKLSGLSRILAATAIDPAKLDLAFVLSNALREMEGPHIRALALINGGQDGEWFDAPSWREEFATDDSVLPRWAPRWGVTSQEVTQWMAEECGGLEVFPAILSTIRRHGLIQNVLVTPQSTSTPDRGYEVVIPTSLGRALLALIHKEAPVWVSRADIERRQQEWLDSDLSNNMLEYHYQKKRWAEWERRIGFPSTSEDGLNQ